MNGKRYCSECGGEMEMIDETASDENASSSSCAPAEQGTSATVNLSQHEEKRVKQTYKCTKCGHEADVFIGQF